MTDNHEAGGTERGTPRHARPRYVTYPGSMIVPDPEEFRPRRRTPRWAIAAAVAGGLLLVLVAAVVVWA